MSMNRSADVFRIKMNGGTATEVKKFTAPISEIAALGRDINILASTENYSYPVAGRQAFIQTVRGIGTWYVDANGRYTLMFSNTADITQCGGVTFTYNNEFFVLHSTTINSNSPGNFRIDIAQCKNGENYNTVVPSKDNLMPTVANKLDESTRFTAGNSNASWYGAEYNKDENCIYIYQYVRACALPSTACTSACSTPMYPRHWTSPQDTIKPRPTSRTLTRRLHGGVPAPTTITA